MSTSYVGVPDTVGRAVGQALVQSTGETRVWSRVDTEGSLEEVRVAEERRLQIEVSVTKRPIDANFQRVYLLGFKEQSFNIPGTRKLS